MINQRKRLLLFAALVAMFMIVLPVFAVRISIDGTTQIQNTTVVGCTLNIPIVNGLAGTFLVDIFDDGVLRSSQPFIQAGPGSFTATYTIVAPAGGLAPGIAVIVYRNGGPAAFEEPVLYSIDTGVACQAAAAAAAQALCSNRAIIPPGSVVGDLPLGGRAYWAPLKITPNVTLNPGRYWVVDTVYAEDGSLWHKIYLSCEYLFVPAEWMSPTFDGPWNGEPLPGASNLPPEVLTAIAAASG